LNRADPSLAGAVRGRLAPSPTGRLHLGNAFAFLLAWLHIRGLDGALALRMEDIDPERSRPEYAAAILEDLRWLGLDWDEGPDRGGPVGPYTQSERLPRYAALLEDWRRQGLLYPCYCTRKELRLLASAPHVGDEGAPYPGTCRSLDAAARQSKEAAGKRACLRLDVAGAVRRIAERAGPGGPLGFSLDGEGLVFDDLVLGRQGVSWEATGGDFALRRSDGVVAYQLAVAADDAAMGITHVLRGEDLLLSTPRQLLLFGLLGAAPPAYAHIPLLHDRQGERLAKRHQSLSLAALREAGVRPEAVVGYLGYLAGCLPRPEAATPAALVPTFSLQRLQGQAYRLPDDVGALLRRLAA
jgi:glutamyl-tRNA synthetase